MNLINPKKDVGILNRKGQGLTEYSIILLLVVLIGSGVWFGFGMRDSETSMYSTIAAKLKSIAGGTENYDTDETKLIDKTLVHFTSLTLANASHDRVMWYEDSKGQRVYVPYYDTDGLRNYLHDASDLQGYSSRTDRHVEVGADGGASTYFKATDGSYYKITDYADKETTLTKYEGTPKDAYIRMK